MDSKEKLKKRIAELEEINRLQAGEISALQSSKTCLLSMMNKLMTFSVDIDSHGQILTFIKPGIIERYEQLIGEFIADYVSEELRSKFNKCLKESVSKTEVKIAEIAFSFPENEKIWSIMVLTPNPRVEGGDEYNLSALDITQYKKTEREFKRSNALLQSYVEKLTKNEERLRAQYDSIPVPTYTWKKVGSDFELVDYNEAAFAITRGGISNYIGAKAQKMYASIPDIINALHECYRDRNTIEEEMVYEYMSTGETKYLLVHYAYVPPDSVLVHTEDITFRKEAEQTISQLKKRLKILDR